MADGREGLLSAFLKGIGTKQTKIIMLTFVVGV